MRETPGKPSFRYADRSTTWGAMSLTVDEAKTVKQALQTCIAELLDQFSADTRLRISEIRANRWGGGIGFLVDVEARL